jgi:hypothetical protein
VFCDSSCAVTVTLNEVPAVDEVGTVIANWSSCGFGLPVGVGVAVGPDDGVGDEVGGGVGVAVELAIVSVVLTGE